MSKFLAALMLSLQFAAVHAEEVHDAPIPAPNYLGIIIFLVLTVGGCWWYIAAAIKNSRTEKSAERTTPEKLPLAK